MLHGGDERFRRLFSNAHVALADADCSDAWALLDALRAMGVGDIRGYFRDRRDELSAAIRLVRLRDVNPHALALFEIENKDGLPEGFGALLSGETAAVLIELLAALWEGRRECRGKGMIHTRNGRPRDIAFTAAFGGDRGEATIISVMDISGQRFTADAGADATGSASPASVAIDEAWSMPEATRESEAAMQRLAAIVECSEDAIISKDMDGIITSWNKGAERTFGYGEEEILGKPVTILIPPDRQGEERDILARLQKGERIEHYETVRRRKDGMLLDISLSVSPVRDLQGRIVGAAKIARDVSERKKMEKQRELLMAELSHRVKNTLATVLSIERLSYHGGKDAAAAGQSFRDRIHALAHVHGRLAESNWLSVSLIHLIEDELAPYYDQEIANVILSGPELHLRAQCTLSLGLALHELATNAAKYGALSTQQGCVRVDWHLRPENGALELSWTESGGPAIEGPHRLGFGRLLLEQALKQELGCTVTLDFRREGLKCCILIPQSEYETCPI